MNIKKHFLILSFVLVSGIALLYGASPEWFARTFLGVTELEASFAHILRAVTGLYLAFGLFWLCAAFSDRLRNVGVLTIIVFCAGLVIGRIISVFVDGMPAPLLQFYIAVELAVMPVAYWVYRLPDRAAG
jgi:hypothetical protein